MTEINFNLPYEPRAVETTSQRNGYPSNIKIAYTDFETFEDAVQFAEANDMDLTVIQARDGQQLYYRTNDRVYDAFDMTEVYNEEQKYTIEDGETFFEDEVKPRLECFNDFYDLRKALDKYEEVYNAIECMAQDQFMIIYDLDKAAYDTCYKRQMSFHKDVTTYKIAAI